MPTTALTVMLPDSVHTTYCMADIHYCQLILNSVIFVPELSEAITYNYVQELKRKLENVFQKANAFCEQEALKSKLRFNRTARNSKLIPGDLVLVKKKGFTSKHRIVDKWETEPYEVVSQRSDGLPVNTVVRNDRERTLHHNMLFLLALWHDIESTLNDMGKSEILGNPVIEQVDNFPVNDGEVDQPVHEGPQTQSCTRQLMKANTLMDQMFEICDDITTVVDVSNDPVESVRDLILQFWYQQAFKPDEVCCNLVAAGTHSINC